MAFFWIWFSQTSIAKWNILIWLEMRCMGLKRHENKCIDIISSAGIIQPYQNIPICLTFEKNYIQIGAITKESNYSSSILMFTIINHKTSKIIIKATKKHTPVYNQNFKHNTNKITSFPAVRSHNHWLHQSQSDQTWPRRTDRPLELYGWCGTTGGSRPASVGLQMLEMPGDLRSEGFCGWSSSLPAPTSLLRASSMWSKTSSPTQSRHQWLSNMKTRSPFPQSPSATKIGLSASA